MGVVLSKSGPGRGNASQETPTYGQRLFLLVEGGDEQALFAKAASVLQITDLHIIDMMGKDDWSDRIEGLLRDDEVRRHTRGLGLVQDADSNPDATWDRCAGYLRRVGLAVPDKSEGIATAAGGISTGIFVVPSLTRVGAVEDLCLDSVVADRRLSLADNFLTAVEAEYEPPRQRQKALTQAFLAAMPELARNLRVGVMRGVFPLSHDAFSGVTGFLASLVEAGAG